MLRSVVLILFSILCGFYSTAQSHIQWTVNDLSGFPLAGATLTLENGTILVTDDRGRAHALLDQPECVYLVSYVGYGTFIDTLHIEGDTVVQVRLEERDAVMEEVEIVGEGSPDQLLTGGSKKVFSIESIRDLPYLLGQQDPIKFIQTQTGVSTGTDGNNGYYVRGGGIDQNMILLDHIELYNTNHLFGFFSTFNAHTIDRVEFLKSGYPASKGGRLSSVLEVHTINPDTEKFTGSFSMSLLSADLNVGVPVIKGSSAMFLSARRSYVDLITQNLFSPESEVRQRTDYVFSDVVWKYDHRIGAGHRLALTGFYGSDDYSFNNSRSFANIIRWNTYHLGGSWKWLVSPRLDTEVYLNAGVYNQSYLAEITGFDIDLHSYISSWKGGMRLFYNMGRHELELSAEGIRRNFRPSQVNIQAGEESYALSAVTILQTVEGSVSIGDQYQITPRLRLMAGVRLSGFAHLGPFTRYHTTENNIVIDSTVYSRGELAAKYIRTEPRVQMTFLLNSESSLKASYDRNHQYIHLSPLSSVSLPTDIWVPSSSVIKPQGAHQFTGGYHRILTDNDIRWSAELFVKLLEHQMEYRNGAIAGYSDSKNFDDDFVFGKGRSYGLELSLAKDSGPVEMQVNYTLARTERIFESLNGAKYFPAKYDRLHDLNVVISHDRGHWTFSGLFKLSSGNALTLPTAKYVIGERVVSEYSRRNAFRMPTYHRLDLAASVHPKGNEQVTWTFSVYNVYNHRNPYFIYFDVQGSVSEYALDVDLEQVSLFPVLPSVSYEYSF